MGQVVEDLPSKSTAHSSNPSIDKNKNKKKKDVLKRLYSV
jgi:hypothetical protein